MTVHEGHDRAAKRLLGDARMIGDALRAFGAVGLRRRAELPSA